MHPTHLIGALALSVCAISSTPAQALMIDNFSDGFNALSVPDMPLPASGYLESSTSASVPGGQRYLALQPLATSPALAGMTVAAPFGLTAFRLTSQSLSATVGYGQSSNMNLDLSGQSALRFDSAWAGATLSNGSGWDDKAIVMTIYAFTSNGAGLNPDGSGTRATLSNGTILDVPFSSFSTNSSTGRPVNWADVDSLYVAFSEADGNPANTFVGFGLRSISAVPEPNTWALLGAGIALLSWRRRASYL